MRPATTTTWIGVGIFSLFAFANHADAQTRRFYSTRFNSAARQEIRGDRREIVEAAGVRARACGLAGRDEVARGRGWPAAANGCPAGGVSQCRPSGARCQRVLAAVRRAVAGRPCAEAAAPGPVDQLLGNSRRNPLRIRQPRLLDRLLG